MGQRRRPDGRAAWRGGWMAFAVAVSACSRGDAGSRAGAPVVIDAGSAARAGSGLLIDALHDAHVPAIALAVVRHGRVERCEAAGDARLGPPLAATTETVFDAASLGKPVVAVAVMQLVEEGLVGLDDDVSKRLPFRVAHPDRAARPITLRGLLTHAASVHDRLDWLARASAPGDPPLALAPFLRTYLASDQPASFLRARPGTVREYSNVGVALAALVVETIRQESFDVVVRRRIFEPLKMRAAFRTAAFAPALVATPHAWTGRAFEARPLLGRAVYPASDLRATACGLGRFIAAMLRGGELDGARVLSRASVDGMLARSTSDGGSVDGGAALGWQLVTLDGHASVGHEGEDDGASAAMFLDRTSGVGMAMLANGDAFASGDPGRVAALNRLVTRSLYARDE